MHVAPQPQQDTIPDLLIRNIPRELILGIQDALEVGAQRAYSAAIGMDEGHLPSVVGHLRHFHMNETFHQALSMSNGQPSPLKGNAIVTGRSGVFRLSRFNIPEGVWVNGRRSQTRRQMSLANKAIEPLVQPELFNSYVPPSEAVAFFVACFPRSLHIHPDAPSTIQIAVPDREMQGWLFKESLFSFLKRYEVTSTGQDDRAKPKLKRNIDRQEKDGTQNES